MTYATKSTWGRLGPPHRQADRTANGGFERQYRNEANQWVGKSQGNTLEKPVKPEIHMLRIEPGWAIDKKILKEATDCAVYVVRLFNKAGHEEWWTYLHYFSTRGMGAGFGHGAQVLLPLAQWDYRKIAGFSQAPLL